MKLSKLRRCHADYDPARQQRYHDIVKGGARFLGRVKDYLPRNDLEPETVYKTRCERAYFLGYVGPICHYFASWLFSSPLTFKLDEKLPPEDSWSAKLKENATGTGKDLDQFVRRAFIDALTHRSAFWRIELTNQPSGPVETLRDVDEQGLAEVRLRRVSPRSIVNWKRDDLGAFEWVLEHESRTELLDLDDDDLTVTETWTQWRADGTARRWELVYPKRKPPAQQAEVPEVDAPYNPLGRSPLIELRLPSELWVVNHLASGQLEHFRKANALSWSIDRTCYAMPWFFVKDRRKPPTMGTGYYGMLGENERVEWPTPPGTPYQVVAEYTRTLKDELHRVTHQMATAVDNNAAAVGRSAESKDADNAATEVVLSAFGKCVREAIEVTWNAIERAGLHGASDGRWHVGGMDDYRVQDAAAVTSTAVAVDSLRIPSVTFRKHLLARVALATVPDLDQSVRETIEKEIEDNVHPEDVLPLPPGMPPGESEPGGKPAP